MELGSTSISDNYLDATSEGSGSYAARAVTLGKGVHTLKEIPQSVTVITRKQLDDQGITDLQDAVNHTTGIVGAQGIGPGVVVTSRGFQIDDWQYDGVPIQRNNYSLGNWAPRTWCSSTAWRSCAAPPACCKAPAARAARSTWCASAARPPRPSPSPARRAPGTTTACSWMPAAR
jgi:hypothetical protein